MNKQAGYITSAHLILISLAAGYFFISKISTSPSSVGSEMVYPTTKTEVALSEKAAKGKSLFMSKCASCHALFKDMTGPSLAMAIKSERWADRKRLYEWVRNPEAFMKTDPYTRQLKKQFGSVMTAFPNLTDEEIDSIVEYINAVTPL